MEKDTKIMLGVVGFFLLLVVGLSFWQRNSAESAQSLTKISEIQISPQSYELGEVDINGGLVTRVYEVKNDSREKMKLQKIVTSCMCTEAKVSVGERESRFFGMEHPGDRNPPINYEIPAGEAAKVTVSFDPAAHGPEGTGPFDRVVALTFSDPAGVVELTFSGTVVK